MNFGELSFHCIFLGGLRVCVLSVPKNSGNEIDLLMISGSY